MKILIKQSKMLYINLYFLLKIKKTTKNLEKNGKI